MRIKKALAEALRVIARNQHGGDLKPRGGSHHDPGQLLRQMQLINNKQRHINDIEAVRSHISVQIMNNSSASRRLRRGASSVPVATFRLFTHGRQEEPYHCATHHEGYRRAEVHYRKAKTHCQCVGERGPITHASDTCARSIELNITASRPVRSACCGQGRTSAGWRSSRSCSGTPQQTAE